MSAIITKGRFQSTNYWQAFSHLTLNLDMCPFLTTACVASSIAACSFFGNLLPKKQRHTRHCNSLGPRQQTSQCTAARSVPVCNGPIACSFVEDGSPKQLHTRLCTSLGPPQQTCQVCSRHDERLLRKSNYRHAYIHTEAPSIRVRHSNVTKKTANQV